MGRATYQARITQKATGSGRPIVTSKLFREMLSQAALLSYAEPDIEKMRQLAELLRQAAAELAPTVTPPVVLLPHSSDAGVAITRYIAVAYYSLLKDSELSAEAMYSAASILEQKAYYRRRKKVHTITAPENILGELSLIGKMVLRDGGIWEMYEQYVELGGIKRISEKATRLQGRMHLSFTGENDSINQFIMMYLLYIFTAQEGEFIEYLSYAPHMALGDFLDFAIQYENLLSMDFGDR